MSDYKIVRGRMSRATVLVFPHGFVYLNKGRVSDAMSGEVGEFYSRTDHGSLMDAPAYTEELTDDEEAIAMKAILLHG